MALSHACAISAPAAAQFAAGLRHDLGIGAPPDAAAAYRCYLAAAQAGLPAAAFNVAVMQDRGRGTPRDAGGAAAWYSRAAALGVARAAYDLGQLYEAGDGVPKNRAMAAAWFRTQAAHLPAANARLQEVNATPPQEADPLAAPSAWPASGGALAWSAPVQPPGVRYLVTLAVATGKRIRPTSFLYTDLSAVPLPRVSGPGARLWRAYAVDLRHRHYAAGPWQALPAVQP